MKNTFVLIHSFDAVMRAGRVVKQVFAIAVLLSLATSARAQISINAGANPTITFDTVPPVAQWATLVAGVGAAGAGTYTTDANVQAGAQTVVQSTINLALPSFTGAFAANASVRYKSDAGYIITQPTTVASSVLRATLRNTSGGTISDITVTYDFGVVVTTTVETSYGHQAFYSKTGLANSWTLIPEFSGLNANTPVSATIALGDWADGTDIYFLWLDDNGATNPDGGYTIDNIVITATPSSTTGITITNSPQSITVNERGAAVFSVGASGSPKAYFWYLNGNLVPGNNQATYTIPSATYPGNNGNSVYVVISNSLSVVTSSTATLTVTRDLVRPTVLSAVGDFALDMIRVTFSEPMQSGGITEASNWRLYETGTDPDSSPFTQTVVLENGTNAVLTTTPARTPGVNYSLRIGDQFDASSGGNELLPNPTVINLLQDIYLIAIDGTKSFQFYQGGTQDGTDWQNIGFNDSSWTPGFNAFSQGPTPETPPTGWVIANTSLIPTSAGGQNTIYFRTHFNLPALPTNTVVELFYWVDDGAVFYLNGKEITRFGIAAGVAVDFGTLAANVTENATATRFVIPATNLLAGDNTFAVEVHQTSSTSTDIALGVQVRARVTKFETGPAIIITGPQSLTVNEGQPASFSVFSGGLQPVTFQWRKGATDLTGQTNSTYSIAATVPSDSGNYRVLVANSLGSSNSVIATLTVIPDTTPPFISKALAGTNLSEIVVTFSERISLGSAGEASTYTVEQTGGGTIDVASALVVNGTNVVLTLSSPLTSGVNFTISVAPDSIFDLSVAQNAMSPLTAPVTSTIILFSFDKIWRYDQSGNNFGTAWKETGFNDSAWPSGPGVLGLDTTAATATYLTDIAPPLGVNTVLALTNQTGAGIGGTNVTFYFRTTVNLASFNPANATMTMRGYIDDGAILYINGTERLRVNYTNAPGYTNLADVASTEAVLVTSNLTGFVQGDNVIAVEVHQNAVSSTDIAWGMQLEAQITSFSPGGPTLHTVNNGGAITITWQGGGTLQRSTNLNSTANWQNIPGATSGFRTNVNATLRQFFRVTVP